MSHSTLTEIHLVKFLTIQTQYMKIGDYFIYHQRNKMSARLNLRFLTLTFLETKLVKFLDKIHFYNHKHKNEQENFGLPEADNFSRMIKPFDVNRSSDDAFQGFIVRFLGQLVRTTHFS